jgi:UDP-N-acetylmuramate dehydrogenase
MSFQLNSKIQLLENEILARHSTFRIGGRALFYAEPTCYSELCGICEFSHDSDLPVFVMGHGSNILFSDEGFPGIVISMRRYESALFEIKDAMLRCSAGLSLPSIVGLAKEQGWGGLEFLAWIPGTVGGAIIRNASCHVDGVLRACADHVLSVEIFVPQDKAIRSIQRQDLTFEYRRCSGIDGVITAVVFSLTPQSTESIDAIISAASQYRLKHQEMTAPSVGCIFKNPETVPYSAGKLIDMCGLKGRRCGDAVISEKHANFILNQGHASARDVLELVQVARAAVKKRFNVDLELEVEYVS